MSSLEAKRLYYDTNTGLMPIIQALIAPPVSEEDAETERRAKREKRELKVEKKEGLDLHPYYKKRGKSHNHDYCDACLEGGNLLCCDTCEASFHLECNDPPLHVDEIPLDMWQCRRCTKLHKESPSKKGSPGKSSKRRKSSNSNTSATSGSNLKKLKTGHGQHSEEEGFTRPPNKSNHYNNHTGGGANDSGDSDISSVSTTRRRGRPRKYPTTTPATSKSNTRGNLSDSDTESLLENRSKRFMKRRKKEPPKSNASSPGHKACPNAAGGDQSTSSDEGSMHTGERDRLSASSSTNNNVSNFGKSRSMPNTVVSSRVNSLYRADSSHIGYLKYSSSDDEDSHSEKSLYFLQGSKPPTEEYLDENTGEIMTRSLCDNEYLSKLLSKKNTTSEIDDIERINELLLKTKNMAMDPNIIKKIIGCSIPEQSDGDVSDNDNAYDTDDDEEEERTSDEDVIMVEKPLHLLDGSTDQQNQNSLLKSNASTATGVTPSISTLPGQSSPHTLPGQSSPNTLPGQSSPNTIPGQSKDISVDPIRKTASSNGLIQDSCSEALTGEQNGTTVQTSVDTKPSDSLPPSNDGNTVPSTTPVPDQCTIQPISEKLEEPKPIADQSQLTNAKSKDISEDNSNLLEEEKEKSDEELSSLIKFNALWREKFGHLEEAAQGSDEEEDEEEEDYGGESESCDDSGEEIEEVKSPPVPVEPMDVPIERDASGLSSSGPPDDPVEENEMHGGDKSETEEVSRADELTKRHSGKKRAKLKPLEEERTLDGAKLKPLEEERTLDDIEIDWSDKSNQMEVRNAMQILLSAVAHSNPEQFSLGKYEDKSYDKYVWPGTDKIPDNVKINSKRVRSLLNLVEVDSDGLVPHPVKICHSCGRTCSRRTPLLGCDYCPLYYHLDCLDPPLTSPPTLTWMCPAHPQKLLDDIVGTEGVVERSEAWDAWSTRPVSEEQVATEFLSKVRSQRIKRARLPTKIPGFVSHHYQCRPELAPSLQEAIQLEAARERRQTGGSSREEKEQFLRSLISLETQLLRLSYENKSSSPVQLKTSPPELADPSTKLEPPDEKLETPAGQLAANAKLESVKSSDQSAAKCPDASSPDRGDSARGRVEMNGGLDAQGLSGQESTDKLDSYFRFGDDFMTPPPSSVHQETVSNLSNFKLDDINPNNFKVEDLFITTTLPLSGSEESLLLDKESRDMSMEEVVVSLEEEMDETETREVEEKVEVKEETRIEAEEVKAEINVKRSLFVQLNELLRNSKLPADDDTGAIIDLSDVQQLNPDLVQVLALERLSQLTVTDPPSLLPQPHLQHPYAPFVPRRNSPPTRLHAQLCPLTRKLSPVPMTTNWMTIGLGSNSTVDLSRFGFCSRVSAQHAVIFYEMASNTYELVNLSEFGCRVDSVLYSLDASLSASSYHYRHASQLPSSAHQARLRWRALVSERIKQEPFELDVRSQRMRIRQGMERRKRRRRRVDEDESEEERMPLHYGETMYKCPCISDEQTGDDHQTSSSRKASSTQTGGGKQNIAWESTCLVRHGSLLQFGCFKFVFSITEHTRTLPPPYDTLHQTGGTAVHRRASQLTESTAELSTAETVEKAAIVVESNALPEAKNRVGTAEASSLEQTSAALSLDVTGDSEPNHPAVCSGESTSSRQGKELKPTRRKRVAGRTTKHSRPGGDANAKNSAGSSTDTCSESEEYEGDKD